MIDQPQYVREALAQVIGAISDCPKGGEALMGRGFDVIAGPIKDVVMAICASDREWLDESAAELQSCRASLKSMGETT